MKLVSYLLVFIFISTTQLRAQDKAAFKKFYRPYSYLRTMDDDQTEARVMGFGLDGRYHHSFSEGLSGTVTAGVRLEAGSNNSLNIKEYSPAREFVLIEGIFSWKSSHFSADVGAIDQEYLSSPLLAGSNAFLGARETFSFGSDSKIYFSFQQSIPNNQTLASRSGGIEEGTPTFFSHEAGLSLDGNIIALDIRAGLFKYNNLSSGVANQSRFMGNDITGTGTLSAFLYDFEGTNVSGKIHFGRDARLSFLVEGQYLFNDKAPDSSNTGYLGSAALLFDDFKLGGEVFRNEANSSPAFYNSKFHGHNNRKGVAGNIKISNLFENWAMEGRLAAFETLDSNNLLISDGQLFTMSFEREFGNF